MLVRKLAEMGAEIRVHDPYVDRWYEFENQDEYPGHSKKVFFRNQNKLKDTVVQKNLTEALKGIDTLVFAVKHSEYLDLEPQTVINATGHPIAVIDFFGILDDSRIKEYIELGCEVKGLGRGHIRRLKESVNRKQ